MAANRIKKISVFLLCLGIIGLAVFPIMGCGGGSGGGSSDSTTAAPQINVSTTQIQFGDIVLDKSSDETISIKNTGSSNLNIGQIAQANPLSAPFSILSDNCSGKQLAPSQECNFQVQFAPVVQGPFTDSFDIPSNDSSQNPVTVNVNGYGRGLKVTINQVYKDTCPNVKVLITVTDKDANPQAGLTENNVFLFENGVPKTIKSISQPTSPISVSLLLDYSGSMAPAKLDMETAAKSFINQLNAVNGDEASIVKFANEVFLVQSFTTDKAALSAAIEGQYPGAEINYTSIYDAIWLAVDDIAAHAKSDRRAIVVISDGEDNHSAKTIGEVIEYANEKGVRLFTIGLGTVNSGIMQQLAEQSGGEYFLAPDSSQLTEIYLKIADILAGQYSIEYESASSGGAAVILDLEVIYNGLEGKISRVIMGCP